MAMKRRQPIHYTAEETPGLRAAKAIAAKMRDELTADPLMRRSRDPYTRGMRAALAMLTQRITERMADINTGAPYLDAD